MGGITMRAAVSLTTLAFVLLSFQPVASAENPVTPQQEGWTIIEKEIPYGDGPGEVGAKFVEGPYAGPRSFTVDSDGTIYVLDSMNGRVQVFSPSLDFLYSINLSQEGGQDVAIDESGKIYILYPDDLKIEQFDQDGKLLSSIRLEKNRWHRIYGFPMYLRGNKLYIEGYGGAGEKYGFVPVGKVIDGVLNPVSPEEKDSVIEATILPSGKIFRGKGKASGWKEAEITYIDGSKKIVSFPASLEKKSILGDDESGNIFFKSLYKTMEEKFVVPVLRYDASRKQTGAVMMPLEAVFNQTRRYLVDKYGNVFSMQAGKNLMLLTVARPN